VPDPIRLKDGPPEVDPNRIGISYSGGGALVVIELGIASAFIKQGIVPAVITGASAGSLAGTAHALDPVDGKGVQLAAEILGHVSNQLFGLTPWSIFGRLLLERENTVSLGDQAPVGPRITAGLSRIFGLDNVTVGHFQPPLPKLMIATTDAETREGVWLPDDIRIEDAVIASSSIPGIFPWRTMTIDGQPRILVDGGVVSNQPLSNLVDQKCGTIYACAVGPVSALPPPKNALDNAMRAIDLAMHQATKLEEAYVQCKLAGNGKVHHIHPLMDTVSGSNFDFTPELVASVMAEAEAQTLRWLNQPGGPP
jgi:predicted acylesterase/phospholipase RssA